MALHHLLLAALLANPGESLVQNGIYCDTWGDARTFAEAYRLTGEWELGLKAVNTPEAPVTCGFATDTVSLYVGVETRHVIRGFEVTIHKMYLTKYNTVQYLVTRERLENA